MVHSHFVHIAAVDAQTVKLPELMLWTAPPPASQRQLLAQNGHPKHRRKGSGFRGKTVVMLRRSEGQLSAHLRH